jgi:hypothetical protein
MKNHTLYIAVAAGILLLASCAGFLQEYPKDQSYVNNTTDLNELLVGEGYMPASTGTDIGYWIHVMDDDALFTTSNTTRYTGCDFYWWEPYVNTESTWTALYKRVGVLNAILGEVERFREERGDGYRQVKGESLFLRASYYYFLVNLYAMPYRATSAATEPGVPLKLSNVMEDKRYTRNSLQECYDRITTDLRASIACLKGISPASTYRAGEMAARHLLARVSLYTGNWEETARQCDTILALGPYKLVDLNTSEPVATANTVSATSPETIFTNGNYTTNSQEFMSLIVPKFTMSDELVASYAPDDLRRTYYYRGFGTVLAPKKWANQNNGRCSDFFIFRLPEVYLNRAEALVALEKDSEAIADLQALRANRLSGTPASITLSGQDLMTFIREERRRELSFEGQRWFDLRRYAVHPKWPFQKEIVHPYYEYTSISGDLVLLPYDEEPEFYVLPLPEREVVLNGGALLQNPVRNRKEYK